MRIPEGDELALLMRCTGYRFNRNGVATGDPDPPTPAEPAGPGGLQKELAKVLPRTDKYQRYGILAALAEVGVLPNPVLSPSLDRFVSNTERLEASRRVRGGPRSDIVLPLAAWRGGDGVDRARVSELFGGR